MGCRTQVQFKKYLQDERIRFIELISPLKRN